MNAVNNLQQLISFFCSGFKRGKFYFAHMETVLPMLSLLGLFKDSPPLKADNFDQLQNRQFKTNKISPYATSVGFALYDCDTDAIRKDNKKGVLLNDIFPSAPTKHMIVATFKEAPVKLPFCDSYACEYDKVRSHYNSTIDGCDSKKIDLRYLVSLNFKIFSF